MLRKRFNFTYIFSHVYRIKSKGNDTVSFNMFIVIYSFCRSCCKKKDKGETVGKRSSEEKPSKLDVKFFSFTTFYYIVNIPLRFT